MNEDPKTPEVPGRDDWNDALKLADAWGSLIASKVSQGKEKVPGWAGHILKQQQNADLLSARREQFYLRLGRDLLISIDPAWTPEEQKEHLEMTLVLARDMLAVLQKDEATSRSWEEGWVHWATNTEGVPAGPLEMNRKMLAARRRFDTDPAFRRRIIDLECEEGSKGVQAPRKDEP